MSVATLPERAAGSAAASLPARILRDAIDPALELLGRLGLASDGRARLLLVAIAGQESGWTARRQHNNGPATGLFQFERSGVLGVLTHRATAAIAARLCRARGVTTQVAEVHAALERDDVLAAGMARLLLYTDPAPLPSDQDEGWAVYRRCWRPGRPRPEHWPARWKAAREVVA